MKKIYTGTCSYCGSVVEFEDEDCDEVEWVGMCICCPVCGLRYMKRKDAKVREVEVKEEE